MSIFGKLRGTGTHAGTHVLEPVGTQAGISGRAGLPGFTGRADKLTGERGRAGGDRQADVASRARRADQEDCVGAA